MNWLLFWRVFYCLWLIQSTGSRISYHDVDYGEHDSRLRRRCLILVLLWDMGTVGLHALGFVAIVSSAGLQRFIFLFFIDCRGCLDAILITVTGCGPPLAYRGLLRRRRLFLFLIILSFIIICRPFHAS